MYDEEKKKEKKKEKENIMNRKKPACFSLLYITVDCCIAYFRSGIYLFLEKLPQNIGYLVRRCSKTQRQIMGAIIRNMQLMSSGHDLPWMFCEIIIPLYPVYTAVFPFAYQACLA